MNSTIPGGMSMQQNNGKPPHQMHGHNQHPSHLQNHINPQNHVNQTVLNHLNQSGMPMPINFLGSYEHVHQSVNVNGVVKPNEQLVYLGGQRHLHMQPQTQYMTTRNTAAVSFKYFSQNSRFFSCFYNSSVDLKTKTTLWNSIY